MQKYGGIGLLAIAFALVACGGRNGVSSSTNAGLTPIGPEMAIQFTLPKKTIGAELPSEGVGTKVDPTWGKVGGYTQSTDGASPGLPAGCDRDVQKPVVVASAHARRR